PFMRGEQRERSGMEITIRKWIGLQSPRFKRGMVIARLVVRISVPAGLQIIIGRLLIEPQRLVEPRLLLGQQRNGQPQLRREGMIRIDSNRFAITIFGGLFGRKLPDMSRRLDCARLISLSLSSTSVW